MKYSAPIATVAVMAFLSACTYWKPESLEPVNLPRSSTIRATLHSGERVIVRSPVISGDTLRSSSAGSIRSKPSILLSDVRTLEREHTNAAAVVVGLVAVGVVALVALAKSIKVGDLGCMGMCAGAH